MVFALLVTACGPADGDDTGTPFPGTDIAPLETDVLSTDDALPDTGLTEVPALETPTLGVETTEAAGLEATATPGLEITATEEITGTPGASLVDPSRVSVLLDFAVQDSSGADLGEVDDLVLNLSTMCTSYVILSPGPDLALENERIAISPLIGINSSWIMDPARMMVRPVPPVRRKPKRPQHLLNKLAFLAVEFLDGRTA